jgi:hypothetical protein
MYNANDLIFVKKKDPKPNEATPSMPCLKDKKGWAVQNGYRILEGQELETARADYLAAANAPPTPVIAPEKVDTSGGGADDTPAKGATTVKPEKPAK